MWGSTAEWLGCFSWVQVLVIPDRFYLYMLTSAARLVYQRQSGVWIASDCTKKTPWYHSKRVGES
jgi:hypothetical protein